MVILRPTRKLYRDLPPVLEPVARSDTALGDWYVNRLVVDRRRLLLVVSSTSLLSLLIPARHVSSLPSQLPTLVGSRLRRLGVGEVLIRAEIASMTPTVVARTTDRSVLGSIVDFVKNIPYYLEIGGWDETTLPFVEARLAETPCRVARRFEEVVFPQTDAPKLLAARWHAA